MASRVLSRPKILHLLPNFPQFHPLPLQKIQSFTTSGAPRPEPHHRAALFNLLRRYGFPSTALHRFITLNPSLLLSPAADVERRINLLLAAGLSPKSLPSLLSAHPAALLHAERWSLVFAATVFPAVSRSFIIEHCARHRVAPDDLRRSAAAFKALGLNDTTVENLFEAAPAAFSEPVEVSRRIEFLAAAVGFTNEDIARICCVDPKILSLSIEGRLRPLFEEFQELGFGRNEVRKTVLDHPPGVVLGMEAGELSHCVRLLQSLKCRPAIKERILSDGALRAGIAVKLRVDCLSQRGLIRRDAFKVLYVEPRTILYAVEEIEEKIEFLLEKLGGSMECLVEFPEYLGLNLEKQIIPRHNVIEHLRSVGGLAFEVELKHLVRLSRLMFYNLYVKPYPECEKIFGGRVREAEDKGRRHPTGLWKLFKPAKYQETEEDVRNMKLFMDSV